jgi:hypothetical protein
LRDKYFARPGSQRLANRSYISGAGIAPFEFRDKGRLRHALSAFNVLYPRLPAARSPSCRQFSVRVTLGIDGLCHGNASLPSELETVQTDIRECLIIRTDGRFKEALSKIAALRPALFLEPNPAGPKFALHLLGRASPEVRLPLVRVSAPVEKEIESAMRHARILA